MNWIDFAAGFFWGVLILLWIILWKFRVERKHKYKWACMVKDCDFRVSANGSHDIVLRVADGHMSVTHGRQYDSEEYIGEIDPDW